MGHTLSNAVLMLKQDWLVLAWLHFLGVINRGLILTSEGECCGACDDPV